jgi:hypothetical protein
VYYRGMSSREYVIKWHRGDKKPARVESIERWARIVSLALIPVVVGLTGTLLAKSSARDQVSLEYVKTALGVLQSPAADERLRVWAVEVVNRFSEIKVEASSGLRNALETGEVLLPGAGVNKLDPNNKSHTWLWSALRTLDQTRVVFGGAGDISIRDITFWNPAASAEMRAAQAESLAKQLVVYAREFSGAMFRGSLAEMRAEFQAVLVDGTRSVKDLADVADRILVWNRK